MQALGLSDTVLYNMRDGFITGVAILDRPCDLAKVVAQIEGVSDVNPGWRQRPFRLLVWSFAGDPQPVDLRLHMSVVRDPEATTEAHVLGHLERLRRSRFSLRAPPWRVIVLNPDDGSPPGNGPPPLSAVFMQMRHGLADATRATQAMSRMGTFEPADHHREIAAALPETSFAHLPQSMTIHDSGFISRRVSRAGMPRVADAGRRLADVAFEVVNDPDLYPGAQPLKRTYGRTHLVRRRGSDSGVGNHIRMETIAADEEAADPGLGAAQNSPVLQYVVAMAPGPLARLMMRVWYANFDAISTLLPVPPKLALGGQPVRAMFGTPPLWGPVPLALIALADREAYNLAAFPGRGFSGDSAALMDRLEALLHTEP